MILFRNIFAIVLMVTRGSNVKPIGMNAGRHHVRMVVFVLTELLLLTVRVFLDIRVRHFLFLVNVQANFYLLLL